MTHDAAISREGSGSGELYARALFEQCNALVLQIKGEMTPETRSTASALRTQYADALAARDEGERLFDAAKAPHEFLQAEVPQRRALEELQQVQKGMSAPAQR